MFLKFQSNKERRAYGGSCFLEIQACSMPSGTSPEKIVDVASVTHWKLSSLYVWDETMNAFLDAYRMILGNGLFNNLKEGPLDPWGINYYCPEKVEKIMERLQAQKPKGYECLLTWLIKEGKENGFYVLGV